MSDIELALVGEDSRAIEKNCSIIQSECQKAHPEKTVLDEKMRRTAHFRLKMCVEKSTASVLECFPCLQQHCYVSFVTLETFT